MSAGPVTVTLSGDYEYADSLARSPEIWPDISLEGMDPAEFSFRNGRGFMLAVRRGGVPCGVFFFIILDAATVEVHTVLTLKGAAAIVAGRAAAEWIFTKTDFFRVTSRCLARNPKARVYASLMGFRSFGSGDEIEFVHLDRSMWSGL